MIKKLSRLAAIMAIAVGIPVAMVGLSAGPAQGAICARSITINDDRGYEGTPSTGLVFPTPFTFTVSSGGSCATSGTITYQTLHFTTNSFDYFETSGTLSFTAGDSSSQTVTVWVRKDGSPGPNEYFWLKLYSGTGMIIIDDAVGMGTILNDDHVCQRPPDIPPWADYHCAE